MAASKHAIQLACECGATLKLSHGVGSVRSYDEGIVVEWWEKLHTGMGHERCTLAEARSIRHAANRVNRDKTWLAKHPEQRRAIQARYRAKKAGREQVS